MTLDEVLSQLRSLGTESVRVQNRRRGVVGDQFGVRLGENRKVAKSLRKQRDLAPALWSSGNLDARLVAILLFRPKALSVDELDAMVRTVTCAQEADWLNGYVSLTNQKVLQAPDVPRLPGAQGLHLALRAHLDRGDGAPAGRVAAQAGLDRMGGIARVHRN